MMRGLGVAGVSSCVHRIARLEMVGGSFTGLTVRTNELLADAPSASATVMAIVAVPDWLAAGTRMSVRLGPLPPRSEERRVGKSGVRGWRGIVKQTAELSKL